MSTSPTLNSLGKPTLKDCGGSNSTFGNMKRAVATRLEATAAEKAVHPMGSESAMKRRRDSLSGFAAAGAAVGAAAALGAPDGAAEPAVMGAAAGFVTAAGDAGAVGCVAGGTVAGLGAAGAAAGGAGASESL